MENTKTVVESWCLRADDLLGEGSFGRVYKATRIVTGQIMAVKKSRASLALKTTVLDHEQQVLQRLQGHPSIPRVFAYGQLEHFEYLAMQLLGTSLGEVRACRPLLAENTLVVADQMISALEHIHTNKLVHCNVKPGNIILHPTDPKRLYLVDYGLTRAIAREAQPNLSTDEPLASHAIGTLGYISYASLLPDRNAGSAPCDDIESLGYTLISLARGDLPWTYNTRHGTSKNQEVQVRIKKQQFSGADMSPDGLPCIETRALAGLLDPAKINWNIPAEALSDSLPGPLICVDTIPLCPGQIVCCQIDVRTTIEGYSTRAGDPLFWRDPSLSPEKWDTAVRPAVLQSIVVICIGQGVLSSTDMNVVPNSSSPTEGSLMPSPTWPLSDSYCYIFPWLMQFITAFGLDFSRGNGEGMPIEWGGCRAWHDEWQTVKEHREKLDQCSRDYKRTLPDSYFALDFEKWGGFQMELSSSVTAGLDDNDDTGLPLLPLIVDIEMSRDVRFM
ncbi:kinase-like domain-containing protein [Suillus fuscotomentosus]|uniref:Kinase-like domain-containing protein n=1 Tax=Suillus fuscotomentosus TaxID=1912939 RepID=A0AAD4EB84_9AGAM|nr:kinase-like domain-containing protein [Suillus fuscotomentosus]KAG1902947.1 kinase-like domain-containing protein [Suillus fuscotomentosus]